MFSRRLGLLALAAVAACTTKESRRSDTTSPATATLAGAPAADQAVVRQAIDSSDAHFAAAFLRGDTAVLANTYAPDAVLMPPDSKALSGHEAIAKGFAAMIPTMHVTQFALHAQEVIVAGDYAIETGTTDMTMQTKGAKQTRDVGKFLTVWKHQPDGSYKIVRDIFNSDGPMK